MEKEQNPRSDWSARLISLFGLDEYGQENLPRVVRLTLLLFAVVLGAQATLDLAVWTYQWYLVTGKWYVAGVFGVITTTLMISVGRMIVVQAPMRRHQDIGAAFGRKTVVQESWLSRARPFEPFAIFIAFIGVIYVLTDYTALTSTVMTFQSEIEKQITRTESQQYQGLVDGAVQTTEQEFGRQIAAQEKEGVRTAAEANARTATDTDAYKKQRAVERASRVESHDAAISIQKETVQRSEQERNNELDEGAGVRVSGAGKFYRTKEANYIKQQEHLQKLQESKIQELRAFDAETLQHVAKKEAARDVIIADSAKAVQQLRSEMQAKVKALRSGPVGSVPGEWRVSRGFAAQKLALAQIESADKTGAMTEKRKENHYLMMIFGLMSVLLKIGLGRKVRDYFDPYAQAARGNEEAQNLLKAEGISDFAAYQRSPEIRDVRVILGDKQQELEMALAAYKMRLAKLAAPIAGSGRYRRLHTIQAQMSAAWVAVAEKTYAETCTLERKAREFGISDAADRMSGDAFWNVTADQLEELGWKETSAEQRAILEAAYEEALRRREEMFKEVRGIESEAARIAIGEYGTIVPNYQKLQQSKQGVLRAIESARLAAAQVVRSFDEEVPEAFDLEAFWRKLIKDLDLIALDKAREKFLEVKHEADRELAIVLQSSSSTLNGSARDMSYRRRREYSQKLLPIQEFIEDLEAVYADALPWIGDPRPFSGFWEVTEEKMLNLGWIPPSDDLTIQDLTRTTSRG
jgi:hypothetical protein